MNNSCDTSTSGPCVCKLAFAIGFVWGMGVLILGLITTATESYGHEMVRVIGSIYWYYEPGSVSGAFWGGLWGFIDGFLGTAIIAMIYYAIKKCGSCCCCGKTCDTKPDIKKDTPESGGDE